MSSRNRTLTNILEYLPIVLTMGFGVYLALKVQLETIDDSKLLGWILTILCLLATSILVDRFTNLRRIEKYSEEVNELLKTKKGKVSLETILSTRKTLPPLEERLQSAKEVVITGGSLFRLSSEYLGLFEKLAKDGCKMKFLMLSPETESAKITAENIVYEIQDYSSYKNYIQSSIYGFKKLKEKYPESVEIRLSEYLPSFSIFGIDTTKDNGEIMIELYTHNVPTRERPHFLLQSKREPFWYKFFLNQFESIWGNAEDV